MITVLACGPEQKLGYIAAGAYQLGQWVMVSGYDSDNVMAKVYSISINPAATGWRAEGQVIPITRFPVDDTEWQSMNTAGFTVTALDHVIGLVGPGIVIEDTELFGITGGNATWTGVTAGCPLRLNPTGFLLPDAARGYPAVAVVENYDSNAGIIMYRTLG